MDLAHLFFSYATAPTRGTDSQTMSPWACYCTPRVTVVVAVTLKSVEFLREPCKSGTTFLETFVWNRSLRLYRPRRLARITDIDLAASSVQSRKDNSQSI